MNEGGGKNDHNGWVCLVDLTGKIYRDHVKSLGRASNGCWERLELKLHG